VPTLGRDSRKGDPMAIPAFQKHDRVAFRESPRSRVKPSIRVYPNMHQYTAVERRETSEHIYRRLFARWRLLFQD